MNVLPSEVQHSIDDLVERAANARLEAEYFESLGLDESAKLRLSEASTFEAEAAEKTAELADLGHQHSE